MATKTVELTDTTEVEAEDIPVATMCPAGMQLGLNTDCLKDCETCEGNLHELCVEESLFVELTKQGI